MAALLAHRARSVTSCELKPELAAFANANLSRGGVSNVAVEIGNGLAAAERGTWDVIALSGSVPFVPPSLLQRLNVGGRLVGIVGELPVMVGQLITRIDEREFSTESMFDTVAPPLVGFPQNEKFRF